MVYRITFLFDGEFRQYYFATLEAARRAAAEWLKDFSLLIWVWRGAEFVENLGGVSGFSIDR